MKKTTANIANKNDSPEFGAPTQKAMLNSVPSGEIISNSETPETSNTQSTKKITPEMLRDLGVRCQQHGELDKAIDVYKAYLNARPHDSGIWSNLGAALRKQKRFSLAVSCYRRGLEYEPNSPALLGNLANALKDLHRLDEALALHQSLVKNNPSDVKTLMNYACALRVSGQFAQALEQLDKAKAVEPDNAGIEWERAQNLLYMGNYKQAWPAYEARWRTGDLPEKNFPCRRWQGENLTGKTLLIHTEQGYGDTIFAARFIPLIKQQLLHNTKSDTQTVTIVLQCKPELHRLFANVGADRLMLPDDIPENIDFHCPIMSLMGALNIDHDSIPEPAKLTIPQQALDKFAALKNQPEASTPTKITNESPPHPAHLDQNTKILKVGIVWSGSITFANNDNRSINLEQLIPISQIPGVRLYSFQKGPRAKELYDSKADCLIQDLGKHLKDFADTAAAIDCMDVILMTDSSVAHLAASLNKPVINLLEKVPYWLYTANDESTPWYPSMRLIKQDQLGDWCDVLERLKHFLNRLVRKNLDYEFF